MIFERIDWLVLGGYFAVTLTLGLWVARRAGRSEADFFLSGRAMPWWLLGLSMVATTFSTDTPNLVTDITRTNGVAGNWVWWAFLITGMLTTFVYAKLWRRSGALTDLEFYEMRYSGRSAAFLRGFRALYLGVFFNLMIMATVTLAAIKIGGVMFGLSPFETIAVASLVTVAFSTIGGLTGVLVTDSLLFAVAMLGSLLAAGVALGRPEVGGLDGLLAHPAVQERLAFTPDLSDPSLFVPLFLVPIAVQWWAAWYPGAEPGGGGYVAQRMLAAKDERHATGATLFFNIAHYALRPWPWIVVALASLVVFPDLASLREAFPHLDPRVVRDDLAYPAMLTFLPHGALGLVVASLAAAYMSTISSHLNWGASYVTHDVYRRFVNPDAGDRRLVLVGRVTTVALMLFAALVALLLENALQAFQILLQIGAGTGLLYLLRWFWWRISAWSEIAAMVVSFCVALALLIWHRLGGGMEAWQELVLGVAITTVGWVGVTLATPPTDPVTLESFYRRTRPAGPGWAPILRRMECEAGSTTAGGGLQIALVCTLLGTLAVYSALFAAGLWIYGYPGKALVLTGFSAVGAIGVLRLWTGIGFERKATDGDS
jgi:Na+/proline symporter